MISRRHFGILAGGTLASVAFGGTCLPGSELWQAASGRLNARPKRGVKTTASTGRLGLGGTRDGTLHLPADPAGPLPFLVLLHGAGGSGDNQLGRLVRAVDEAGVAVLAPDSRTGTWDAIQGGFGPDVAFLDQALARVFETVNIDPARTVIGGFSDGASYALSLGLINGDLFPRVLAFSPGFVVPGELHGKARFFISHGTADPILPIDQCSRRIVPALRGRGYDVTFREFDGRHEVPPAVATEGMKFVTTKDAGDR